jgi:SnoaL-like protein
VTDSEKSYSGTIVAAILLAVMIAGIGYRYWPSDERAIRRHLSNLAEALSFPLTESEEERLTRVAVLREYFAPDVRVILDDRELSSRDEIINLLSSYRPPPGGVNVEFVNIVINVADDHQTATVTLTARMSSTNEKGVSVLDERAANLTMRNVDDDWAIANVVLRAPTALVLQHVRSADLQVRRIRRA